MNMIPIARVNDWIDAQIESKKPPAPAPPPPPAEPLQLPPSEEQINAFVGALEARLEEQAAILRAQQADLETTADLEAALEAARAQLLEAQAFAERIAARLLESEGARVLAEAQAIERQAAAEARAMEIRRAETQLEAITRAHRALILEAVERLLAFEAARALKAQATPEKLRAWIETFYATRAEMCRAVYRPVILAWAACAGLDAEASLEDVVRDHIEQSRRELRAVAEADDPEELSAALARLLRRWETERAPALADRLMAEGDRYGH